MRVLATGLVLALLTAGASAQERPWGFDFFDFDEFDTSYYAEQTDDTGGFKLVYECDSYMGESSISVETPEPWRETITKNDRVTPTFFINGAVHDKLTFGQSKRGGTVTAASYAGLEDPAFLALYEAIKGATGQIQVSIFHHLISFPASDVASVINTVDDSCLF